MNIQQLALALVVACTLHSASAEDVTSIYGIGAADSDFSTLVAAVDAAGLKDALSGDGAMTLFAPPNSAFDGLPEGLVTKLLEEAWKPQLVDLLQYHVLPATVMSTQLTDGMTTPTLNSEDILINLAPTRVNENSAVTLADISASNGVIHTVDAVLTPESITSNIVEIAQASPDTFSTLVTAVTAADLAGALSGPGPFTLFAPTNDAFAALGAGTVENLLKPENKETLANILKYHVVSGNIPASAVETSDVPTLLDIDLSIVVSDEGVKINDVANVIKTDVLGNNGIIHVIDAVLLPASPSIYDIGAADPDYSTLVAAVDAAGLKDALSGDGTLTLFAPPNSAFDGLPDGLVTKLLEEAWKPQLVDLLQYHVLPVTVMSTGLTDGMTTPTLNSEDILINLAPTCVNENSAVTEADISASNGVIHTVDAVLTPKSITSNIVEIAQATPDTFSTLVTAVTAADLAGALSGPGPFTLFAPTNDAFAALETGTVENLLKPESKETLAAILKYHVVSGNIPASAVETSAVPTLQGADLSLVVSDKGVKINDVANVIKTDVLGNNGIIHVIDAVLMPPNPSDVATNPPTKAPTKAPTVTPEEPNGAMTYGFIVAVSAVAAGAISLV